MIESLPAEKVGFLMPGDEARAQISRLKYHWEQFWFELKDFHANKRWTALGYTSFKACVESELGLSERRAYQILQAAEVHEDIVTERAFSNGQSTSPTVHITEYQARVLAPLPSETRREIAREVDVESLSASELKALLRKRQQEAFERESAKVQARRSEQADLGRVAVLPPAIDVRCGDFREALADVPDHSVDLIFTDPPYPRAFLPLWRDLGAFAARVLKPGGMLVAYSGQVDLPSVMSQLAENLTYWWLGAIVHGGPGMMQLNDQPVRKFVNGCKPLLFYVPRGYTGQSEALRDTIKGEGSEKDAHDWQQGLSEAEYYIEHLTADGGTVVDPFLGGGTTGVASRRLGRHFIGCEIDANTFARAKERLSRS